jgi:hypothetical protein
MDATTWTSAGTTQTIVNQGQFRPDLVWNKERSGTSNHFLNDSVRGAANYLSSNTTTAETALSTYLTSFNSNGFTMGTTQYGSGSTVVGWQWQAGQGSTSSNTSGSITSTVSVNTTAGFSIVTYTGTGANATVGHGLGVAPRMIIAKRRVDSPYNWPVYHAALSGGANDYLILDTTNAKATNIVVWNNTNPTSSVFSIGTDGFINASTKTYVAYCWAEIAGFSRFGSYTGNGSADGPFVYLGFRPAFVLLKNANTTDSWVIKDDQRAANFNPASGNLYPNLTAAEDTGSGAFIDFLSNGFKVRGSNFSVCGSGNTIIFAAFAENPFKNANAR